MHIFLVFALVVGFIYSLLKLFNNKLGIQAKIDALVLFVLLKIITAICLFIFINNSLFVFKNISKDDDTRFLLSLQLLTYTIGDVFILWNEILAITFFGMGHVFFLNLFMFHQFIEVMTHPVLGKS